MMNTARIPRLATRVAVRRQLDEHDPAFNVDYNRRQQRRHETLVGRADFLRIACTVGFVLACAFGIAALLTAVVGAQA